MNSILYNGITYEGRDLMGLDCHIGDSLVGDELAVDTLTAIIRSDTTPLPIAANELLMVGEDSLLGAESSEISLEKASYYGDPIALYRNGSQFAKFYLENMKRTGKNEYTFDCVSAIGLLLTSDHYGGLYTGETAAEVMEDVIGGIITYTLDDELASVPIYGLLPKATRRDNLRDLLFAIGGQIRKDSLGELHIVPMTASTPYEIAADDFYTGGSVTGGKPATRINLTEHSFVQLASDELVTLYDGETAAEEMVTPKGATVVGALVDFSDPMHDLEIKNAEILESGVNYAVISGSPAAVLTGKKYTHSEKVISRSQKTGGSPNVISSSACTLINVMNSELVADRLMAYYGAAKTIEADIVVNGQKPGDAVTFEDPFGDPTTGYIADMELTISTIVKAKATLISGYIPVGSGNYYSNLMVITESGTFTVPNECKGKMRVVIIGGGDGGCCGEAGETGEDGTAYSSLTAMATGKKYTGSPGSGGAGGKGGNGGKVLVATINTQPGETVEIVVGTGGEGAEFGGEPGQGTETTFGTLSSASGYRPDVGYAPMMGGAVYATQGADGVAGGRGQEIPTGFLAITEEYEGERPVVEYDGESWQAGSTGTYQSVNPDEGSSVFAAGGTGGGAAVGLDGEDGADGYAVLNVNGSCSTLGGNGGAGSVPVDAPAATIPGSGGHGGHGGGGGGGGGAVVNSGDDKLGGFGGSGGNGGKGGNGAPGAVLIYY